MYCNGKFIKIFIIFVIMNMSINVVSEIKIETGIKRKPWQASDPNDPKKLSKPELLEEREKLLKKQLSIINGHLYDTLKERLNLIQKDLQKVSKDLDVEYPPGDTDERLTKALHKRSSVKDNLSEEYKKSMDKIDNQITMEGDNQNLMGDRSDRSFLSWYKGFISVPKLLYNYNNNGNDDKIFQTKYLVKKNFHAINPTAKDIESNQTLVPLSSQQTLYDFSRRNTIKESLFEEYCKQMDIIANTLLALDKRSYLANHLGRREIYLQSHPLERNKWLTSKGEYHKNDFDEGIWKTVPLPLPIPLPFRKRSSNEISSLVPWHPLDLNKWLTTKNRDYYSNDFDENTWKTMPTILDLRKRRNCRNVDTYIHYHPLKINKWLGTKGGEYYKSDFDQNIWNVQRVPSLPLLTLSNLRKSSSLTSDSHSNSDFDSESDSDSHSDSGSGSGSGSDRRRGATLHKHPAELNKWLLTKGGEYYKNDLDQNLWKLPSIPPTPMPLPDSRIPYQNFEMPPTSKLFSRDIKSKESSNAHAEVPTTNKAVYPNVLTKAVEISLNPSNKAHSGGNLLANVAKKLNTSTLDLAEKIANSADVNSLSVLNNDATLNKMTDTYSKTVITPKPITVNNQPNVLNIIPSVAVTPTPKSSNGSVENNTNSKPEYIIMPSDPNVNVTQILDQVLEKLETIQRNKVCEEGDENARPEGIPCDIVGLWSSQSLGFCLNIEIHEQKYRDNTYADKYHNLKVEAQDCTPPKTHNLLELDWSFGGATQKQTGGPFYMYAYKQSERSLATFTGFCRTCFGADTLFGSWTAVTPNKDCSDILLAFNNKPDVLKRIQLESKRKERYKNLLLQQQQQSKTIFT